MVAPGQIVILNGTSSSGKTTTALAFQQERALAGECWVVIGLDEFIGKLPDRWVKTDSWAGSLAAEGVRLDRDGDRASFHVGEQARRLFRAYRRSVAEISRAGVNVIVDEVAFEQHEWDDWCEALVGLPRVWVALHCDVEVAARREAEREDRATGLARTQADLVHRFPSYDLELDSTTDSAVEVARGLQEFLAGR